MNEGSIKTNCTPSKQTTEVREKFVTPLFGILGSFGFLFLANCCGSFSLDSSLFFRKLIFYNMD